MSKRTYEEAEASINSLVDAPQSKKAKKRARVKRTPEERHRDAIAASDAAVAVANDPNRDRDLTKDERRLLKRAKSHAKKLAKANGTYVPPPEKPIIPKPADNRTRGEKEADFKARCRAEKAARKAAKRAAREANGDGVPNPKVTEPVKPVTIAEPSTSKTDDEAERADAKTEKADAKAEKAARRAAKRAAREAKDDGNPDEADTTPAALPTTSSEPAHSTMKASFVTISATDATSYFKENQITIDEDPSIKTMAPALITDFAQLDFASEAERAPFASFKAPTPIQAATWPYLLAGRDAIGVAETGSGKTWAFGVPCIRFIKSLSKEQRSGANAVIVSPTRELALQIQEQIEKLAGPAKLKTVCVYGGVDKEAQRMALKKAKIIVATPGRLNDLLDEGSADLSNAHYVVLDEADRMLDKGFEDDVRKIISATSSDRQTLMFTATWPPSVRELAATFMKTPVKIIIGDNPTGELRANTRIAQQVQVVERHEKNGWLMQLLKQHQSGAKKNDRILIFCLYKKEAQRVHQFLQDKGFRVAGIHGDMNQQQRERNLEEFKSGKSTLLVATDVAARGLDIPAVKVVINVTFPLTAEDYVHRIGRTGRAGQDGLAITLFTEDDKANSGALVNVLRAANQPVPEELLKFGTTVKKKEHSAYGAFYKDVDMTKKATKITFD